MKPKHLQKKLTVKKVTVSNLNGTQLQKAKGGRPPESVETSLCPAETICNGITCVSCHLTCENCYTDVAWECNSECGTFRMCSC